MKSILFAGGALMVAATVYGVMDLRNTSRKKEFTGMYSTETPAVPAEENVVPQITEEKKPEPKSRKVVVRTEKPAPAKTDVRKYVSRVEPIVTPTPAVKTDELKEPKTVKTTKKPKRVNHKLFSRGSMEERYVEKTLKLDAPEKAAPAKEKKDE
ncbi:MAG TPA: hypothetical protein VEB63_05440 [Chitinophagaceae bacterium]|nr:hypothetical protein [Chitinophagaceae bacterium]